MNLPDLPLLKMLQTRNLSTGQMMREVSPPSTDSTQSLALQDQPLPSHPLGNLLPTTLPRSAPRSMATDTRTVTLLKMTMTVSLRLGEEEAVDVVHLEGSAAGSVGSCVEDSEVTSNVVDSVVVIVATSAVDSVAMDSEGVSVEASEEASEVVGVVLEVLEVVTGEEMRSEGEVVGDVAEGGLTMLAAEVLPSPREQSSLDDSRKIRVHYL